MSLKDVSYSEDKESGEMSDDWLDEYDPADPCPSPSSDSASSAYSFISPVCSPPLSVDSFSSSSSYSPTCCPPPSTDSSSSEATPNEGNGCNPLPQPQCSGSIDDPRPLRKKQKCMTSNCPICGITLRPKEIKDHYEMELKKLDSLQKKHKKLLKDQPRYETLQEIRSHRMKRRKDTTKVKDVGVNTCQLCYPYSPSTEMVSSHDRRVLHLSQCADLGDTVAEIIMDESLSSEEESYDISSDETIQLTSFIGGVTHVKIKNTSEDAIITIDSDDDDATFGPSEFTERDLQPCESTLSDENVAALREAILSSTGGSPETVFPEDLDLHKDDDEFSVIFVLGRAHSPRSSQAEVQATSSDDSSPKPESLEDSDPERDEEFSATFGAEHASDPLTNLAEGQGTSSAHSSPKPESLVDSDPERDEEFSATFGAEHASDPLTNLAEVQGTSSAQGSPKPVCPDDVDPEKDDEFSAMFGAEHASDPGSNLEEVQGTRLTSSTNIVLCALKNRLRELENEVHNCTAKCNICLEGYKEPLVSITCWHVSCKECWMKTLGEKKLCPQCTRITLPANLRRIFI